MAANNAPVTYRLRHIPHNVTVATLPGIVKNCFSDVPQALHIQVRSLAPSPDDWSTPSTQTATVEFTNPPPDLQDPSKTEWVLTVQETGQDLLLDRHFLGFTQLNAVNSDTYVADCIAISGLAGHPFGSWRQRTQSSTSRQFMWLRDQLPNTIPGLRVMIYGFDTDLVGSESVQNIDDLARSFVLHLKNVGLAEPSAKSLVILAHSLGGVIAKRATLYMAESNEAETSMLDKVRLFIFFGVPNNGMHIKHLRPMVQSQPNRSLVECLSIDSPYLTFVDKNFSGIAQKREIRVVSAFETKESRTAEIQATGIWKRTGPLEVLVTRGSAIHCGSRDPQDIIPVNQDHSNIVKFVPNDVTFNIVQVCMSEVIEPIRGEHTRHGTQSSDLPSEHLVSFERSIELIDEFIIDDLAFNSRLSEKLERNEKEHLHQFHSMKLDLSFADLDFRLQAIEDAHDTTFGWIFDEQDLGFLDWAGEGHGLYWIRGKPGSGKSTMMRYLYQNRDLRRLLSTKRGQSQRHAMWFFFSERGAYLQRTMDGLFRTILLQLINSNSFLATVIFRNWYQHGKRTEWSLDDLRDAFDAVLSQSQFDIELVLFLDALDEYQGFPQIIAKWLFDLSETSSPTNKSRTRVKICFASREWDAFVTTFGESCRGFKLHEYTTTDIQQYITSRASALFSDRSKSTNNDQPIDPSALADLLAKLMTRKAEGVFLWVKLALDTLAASTLPESPEAIEQLIDGLPDQLESFYTVTIQRIPRHTRHRAFVLIELVLRSPNSLTISDLFYAAECSRGETREECREINWKSRSRRDKVLSNLVVELHNLCAGLLECKKEKHGHTYVQFIHKTVKDFVARPGFPQLFLGNDFGLRMENGHTWLMKYLFTKEDNGLEDIIALWHGAHHSERSLGRSAIRFIDSVNADVIGSFSSVIRRQLKGIDPEIYPVYMDHLMFATWGDLRLYLLEHMRDAADRVLPGYFNPFHAIAAWVADEFTVPGRSGLRLPNTDLTDMCRILFGLGFRLTISGRITPWDLLFRHAIAKDPPDMSRGMVELAETMIVVCEQDPNQALINWAEAQAPAFLQKALHVSIRSPDMIRMLVQNHADPNVKDAAMRTPLDNCIRVCLMTLGTGAYESTRESSRAIAESAIVLVAHGGQSNKYSAQDIGKFIHELKEYAGRAGLLLPEAFDHPSQLRTANMRTTGKLKNIFSWKKEG